MKKFLVVIMVLILIVFGSIVVRADSELPQYFNEARWQAQVNACSFGGSWEVRYGEHTETGFVCDESAELEGMQIAFENAAGEPKVVEKKVPLGHYAVVWGTTLKIDGEDRSGAVVNYLGSGEYSLSEWSWGSFLLLIPEEELSTNTPTVAPTNTSVPTETPEPTATITPSPMVTPHSLAERNSVAQARINQCIYPHPSKWEALVNNVSYGRHDCGPAALGGNIQESGVFGGEGTTISFNIADGCHILFWGEDALIVAADKQYNILRNSINVLMGPDLVEVHHIKWGSYFLICDEREIFLPLIQK